MRDFGAEATFVAGPRIVVSDTMKGFATAQKENERFETALRTIQRVAANTELADAEKLMIIGALAATAVED